MNRRTPRRVAVAALTAFAAMLATAVSADFAMAAELPHEAESMTYGIMSFDGTMWPKPIADGAASAGKAVHDGPNGTAAKTVTTTTALTAVSLRARGNQCDGAPAATVALDGTTIGTVLVSSTSWAKYSLPVSRPAGAYDIAVSFDNNYYTAKCNRDLLLDKFTLSAADTAPPVPAGTVVLGPLTPSSRWRQNGRPAMRLTSTAGNATSTLSSSWTAGTRVRQVSSPVAQGQRAYAMTVRAADRDAYTSGAQRTEVGQNNGARTSLTVSNARCSKAKSAGSACKSRSRPTTRPPRHGTRSCNSREKERATVRSHGAGPTASCGSQRASHRPTAASTTRPCGSRRRRPYATGGSSCSCM